MGVGDGDEKEISASLLKNLEDEIIPRWGGCNTHIFANINKRKKNRNQKFFATPRDRHRECPWRHAMARENILP
jgi:hypothetical protein